jgi:uncharacterized membrane protein
MGIVEDIGEETIRIASQLYRLLVSAASRLRRMSPYPFFEKRGIDKADYTVLQAQLAALLFLFFSVLYLFEFINAKAYALSLIAGAYTLILLPRMRRFYPRDYPAYRDFFLGYLAVAVLLVGLKALAPWGHPYFPQLPTAIISILYITVFSYLFKRKYGRGYTYGRVIKGGSPAEVRLGYDLRAGVKPSRAFLDNMVGAKEGDTVVVEVRRSSLNLRGAKPLRILRVHEGS